jgi:XTP/dITP diphosphohydrolase
MACFSEDTGLEVTALNGEPGVKSARYSGDERSDEANIKKLLTNLELSDDRSAQFRTVTCLIIDGAEYFFEGTCKGKITTGKLGSSGFGYDPVFIPDGASKTFGEMTMKEKNQYSHRRKAITKLVTFLNNLF